MLFSCIIPAYNEWPRIAKVLETVLACEELHEIIVVDDGSTDDTWEVIETFQHQKLQKIRQQKNGGKTNAVLRWINISKWNYIVMIDSDLLNLKVEHINSLIKPIKDKEADVTFSIRENSLKVYKWLQSDFVSGERIVPREIFEDNDFFISCPWFWLEVKLNEKIIAWKYTIKNIYFPNVISPRKVSKSWIFTGTLADVKMVHNIISVVSIPKLLYQIRYFSRLHQK